MIDKANKAVQLVIPDQTSNSSLRQEINHSILMH